ncbi:hypothetical protein H5410_040621 [Solanum commersonii]|uniref:Kinesin motor domain-containing protein n=1 Tax=Solanum commersonii TaxID=4109 RepID=A0A9J5XPC4_SOLCO|nr:hypothetical protein H5410_040621 [Solanum commersonii]
MPSLFIGGNSARDLTYFIALQAQYALSTTERDFVLKFSALEIYNETIDTGIKGIIVEKLVDETVNDGQHPRTLIGTCKDNQAGKDTGPIST